jgi:M6 family metalloprotease-like protein
MRASVLLSLAAGACLCLGTTTAPPDLAAQDVEMRGRVHGKLPPPGYREVLARDPGAYRFQRVWKEKARQVMERRRALARDRDYGTLNAHFRGLQPSVAAAQASGAALADTFEFPVLIGLFVDSTHVYRPDSTTLHNTLFSTTAAPPYSVTTYYDEVSNGLLTVSGDIVDWVTVDSVAGWYEGSNNGLDPNTDHTGAFIKALLDSADASIDFSNYDGDNDGFVDLVAILHPLKDGACQGSVHIWSHRWVYRAWNNGTPYFTNDGVTVDDYVIQPAVGGAGGCDSTSTMAIGTTVHELGHGILNLPDLYDTGTGGSEGIGWWGLMGSGNWNIPTRPAHMSAWSKDAVGWIAVDTVRTGSGTGSHVLYPIVTSDTALRVEVSGTNEYFLIENRAWLGSDAYLAGEGLLIWHVDPDRILARWFSNTVNAVVPHGLDLEQADGWDHLGNGVNRGDAGDPWPGSSSKTAFGPGSTPNSELNDNSNSGILVDSITVNADKSIGFRVNINLVGVHVSTNIGAGTEVIFAGDTVDAPYDVIWAYPTTPTIGVEAVQGDTLTRYTFQSWSDLGFRIHAVSISDATPDTFIATLQTEHRLRATNPNFGTGTINSSVTLDANGIAWLTPGSTAQLQAVPAGGFLFVKWSGDTTTITDTLTLTLNKPYTMRARFGIAVAVQSDTLAQGAMGATYTDTLTASGGVGEFSWARTGGDALPVGLTLAASGAITGVPEEDGDFNIQVAAVDGALADTATITIIITRPSLVLDNVVNHLLSPVSVLTADEERFLDIIGNQNGGFDIGDFRAYLQEAGLVAADVLSADVIEALEQLDRSNRGAARKEEGR